MTPSHERDRNPTTAVAKVYRVSTHTTGRQSWSGNAVANSITAMAANQITVGTALNATGVTYDVWAIRPGFGGAMVSTMSQCRILDGLGMTPRPLLVNALRFEEPNHRFGEGIVIGIAAAADRRLDAGVSQALGVAHRQVLRAAIAIVDQIAGPVAAAGVDRLLESLPI